MLAPVILGLRTLGQRVALLAKGPATEGFAARGIEFIEIGDFDKAEMERLCIRELGGPPDLVFTSATSLPQLDMTERLLWRWAAERGIPSAAIIDQWQNYAIRFSGEAEAERLAYLPDRIMVMDDLARCEAIASGLPAERLVVTGQPAFDSILREHWALPSPDELRAAHGLPVACPLVTFVAERLGRDFADSLGYDEVSTLEFLGGALDAIAAVTGPLTLAVKLHPQNTMDQFDWAVGRWPRVEVHLFAREITPRRMIAASDLVVGMSSVMLVESILVGRPTVSIELDARREPQLVAARTGAIPGIRRRDEASNLLRRLLTDARARDEYLAAQNAWGIGGDAVARCIDLLSRL